jgi:hypothetical protein
VKGIVADHNVEGQLQALLQVFQSDTWREMWGSLGLSYHSLADLGLSPRISDRALWQYCQDHLYVLLTDNRNYDGPDSLEATIRELNVPYSLPVFTLANSRRVQRSKAYADLVAERFLECLIAIENYRGSGRIYLP